MSILLFRHGRNTRFQLCSARQEPGWILLPGPLGKLPAVPRRMAPVGEAVRPTPSRVVGSRRFDGRSWAVESIRSFIWALNQLILEADRTEEVERGDPYNLHTGRRSRSCLARGVGAGARCLLPPAGGAASRWDPRLFWLSAVSLS